MDSLARRVSGPVRAAARLAAVYAAGVAVLVLGLAVWVDGLGDVLRELTYLAIPAAVCFGSAFALLALARRAGFSALWVAALALWVWATLGDQPHGPRPGAYFVLWSIFTAPLYAIVRIGFGPSGPATARLRRLATPAFAVAWAALAALGLRFEHGLLFLLDAPLPWWFALADGTLSAAWHILPAAATALALRLIHRDVRQVAPAA